MVCKRATGSDHPTCQVHIPEAWPPHSDSCNDWCNLSKQIEGLAEYQKASDALYKIVTDKVQKYLNEPWTSPDVEALDAITFKVCLWGTRA